MNLALGTTFANPAEQGQSEYRLLIEHLAGLVIDSEVKHAANLAISSLDEIITWAEELRRSVAAANRSVGTASSPGAVETM